MAETLLTYNNGVSAKIDDNSTLIIGDGCITNWALTFGEDYPTVEMILGLWDRNEENAKYPPLKSYTYHLDKNGYTLWIEPVLPAGFKVQVGFIIKHEVNE